MAVGPQSYRTPRVRHQKRPRVDRIRKGRWADWLSDEATRLGDVTVPGLVRLIKDLGANDAADVTAASTDAATDLGHVIATSTATDTAYTLQDPGSGLSSVQIVGFDFTTDFAADDKVRITLSGASFTVPIEIEAVVVSITGGDSILNFYQTKQDSGGAQTLADGDVDTLLVELLPIRALLVAS